MSNNKAVGTVVFDLDGTLVDSALDLIPSLNRTTARHGLSPISYEQISKVVGHGGRMMIQRAFELNDHPFDDPMLDKLLPHFFADYEENISDNTKFYEGCLDALDLLAGDGWQLAVCSNKHEKLVRKLLSSLREEERFVAVTGGDTFNVKKPNPGHLLKTIEQANGHRASSIMVGDSNSDISAAQAAGIPVIAVDFGYTDVPVSELKPDAIISHFSELVGAMSAISNVRNQWQRG